MKTFQPKYKGTDVYVNIKKHIHTHTNARARACVLVFIIIYTFIYDYLCVCARSCATLFLVIISERLLDCPKGWACSNDPFPSLLHNIK